MKMITAPIIGLLAIVGMLPPSCMANQYRNSLRTGDILKPSEALISRRYVFIMQPDCNLVLYHDSSEVWSTGTGGRDYSCSAKFLRGGNLVVYTPKGVSLWESGTGRDGTYVLVLQKDGNVAIYGPVKWSLVWPPKGNPVPDQWLVGPEPTNILYPGERLKTNESLILGNYSCTMRKSCTFSCHNGTTYVWATNTAGKGTGCYFEFESWGKMAIYDSANSRVWALRAWQFGSYVLIIQKFPIFGVYGPKIWSIFRDRLTSNATAQFSNRKIARVMTQ